MIAENKDIANLYDIEYEAGCFVNSYDYKFVTFIRVIRKVRLLANRKTRNYTNFVADSSHSNSVKERFSYAREKGIFTIF